MNKVKVTIIASIPVIQQSVECWAWPVSPESPETAAAAGTISVAFKAIKDAVCTASTCQADPEQTNCAHT